MDILCCAAVVMMVCASESVLCALWLLLAVRMHRREHRRMSLEQTRNKFGRKREEEGGKGERWMGEGLMTHVVFFRYVVYVVRFSRKDACKIGV